jgi:hypothetical protein
MEREREREMERENQERESCPEVHDQDPRGDMCSVTKQPLDWVWLMCC